MSKKVEGDYFMHTCNRCDHIWYSKKDCPQNCVSCKSPYWNKERV